MFALLVVVVLEGGQSFVAAAPSLFEDYNSCLNEAANAMNFIESTVPDISYKSHYECVEMPNAV